MTRRISQSITPTVEDVAALRGPFISKGANDPVIKALREYFKQTSPVWLAKLDEKQELTRERLAEIRDAAAKRRAVIEALPDGKARDKALADLEQTDAVVEEMDTALAGAGAFGGSN
ncbi:hypothetical protein [Rhodococcus rhodochrous]|uniref:Uncharacterized protein n=2 Tax=Rhodococcus rhodochrous TaxID=1829 RepID=A0A562DKR1_RHORH|nr:hypothetical protein [Rhodococcus rhodochrous]TWH10231.1 hypothetical protein L618_004300000200 [Rhodococcus rhodochrous J45]UZF48292.1 hypothetical protein KUM34_028520 [Rhodococcus rhodochrous]